MKSRKYPLLILALLVILLPTFQTGFSDAPAASAGDRLSQDSTTPPEVTWNPASQVASFVIANVPARALGLPLAPDGPVAPEAVAGAFLTQYADLFGLRDAKSELNWSSASQDALGVTHVTSNQVYKGLPVYGARVSVHMSADGTVRAVNSGLVPLIQLSDVTPAVTAEEAGQATLRDMPDGVQSGEPYLAVYVNSQKYSGDQAHLAWIVDRQPAGGVETYRYAVDARTGKLLDAIPLFIEAIDRKTYDAQHKTSLPGVLRRSEGQGPIGDQDLDRIHDFAGEAYNYYYTTHGRDSFDSLGHTITSSGHYGQNYMNAGWSGDKLQFIYGDGIIADDVVAHEFTHAVVQYSANLEYRWQSGALNESIADIFGAMVDREDWLIGEDLPDSILAGREALRDMADPARFGDPAHTKDWVETCSDDEGVHTNSGIFNKAYYNIATSIGKPTAELIFYRALTTYLDDTSSFEDARAAALSAAADLYGSSSDTYKAIDAGFRAVGLDGVWNPSSNDCICSASVAVAGEANALDTLGNLYAFRNQVLSKGPGPRWVQYYYENQLEVARLFITDPQLRKDAQAGLQLFSPAIDALVTGSAEEVFVTEEMVKSSEEMLMQIAADSPATKDHILKEWEQAQPSRFIGWTVQAAWDQILRENTNKIIFLPLIR